MDSLDIVPLRTGIREFPDEQDRAQPLFLDLKWNHRLMFVEKKASIIQYQLACLSTLGGAYHLCNHPKTALKLAMQQEFVGRTLGSSSVVIRSQVFQAVNWTLLGKPKIGKRMFAQCRRASCEDSWTGMLSFVEASELWLAGHMAEQEQQRKDSLRIRDSASDSPILSKLSHSFEELSDDGSGGAVPDAVSAGELVPVPVPVPSVPTTPETFVPVF
jgi:hypothetical protein